MGWESDFMYSRFDDLKTSARILPLSRSLSEGQQCHTKNMILTPEFTPGLLRKGAFAS